MKQLGDMGEKLHRQGKRVNGLKHLVQRGRLILIMEEDRSLYDSLPLVLRGQVDQGKASMVQLRDLFSDGDVFDPGFHIRLRPSHQDMYKGDPDAVLLGVATGKIEFGARPRDVPAKPKYSDTSSERGGNIQVQAPRARDHLEEDKLKKSTRPSKMEVLVGGIQQRQKERVDELLCQPKYTALKRDAGRAEEESAAT